MCGDRCRRITKISSRTGNIMYNIHPVRRVRFRFLPEENPRTTPTETPPTLHYIIASFSRTATIKTISDYLRDDNNNIMFTK